MANKIVSCRWGSVYTQEHVDKLYDRAKANCSVDFDFYCFDDIDNEEWKAAQKKHFRGLDDPDMRAQKEWSAFERDDCGGLTHYRKFLMFDKDTELFNSDDTILFMDLDVLILGDLSYFFDLDNEKPWLVKSYWFDGYIEKGQWQRQYYLRRCPYFNSSVQVWKPGQNRVIFDMINDNLDKVFFQYGVNDNFLFHTFGPWTYEKEKREHFNVFDEGIITSQKYCTDRGIIHSFEGYGMEDKKECWS